MAPKSKAKAKAKAKGKAAPLPFLSTDELQTQHGQLLLQPPFSECPTPFLLHKALQQRRPIINVTMGVAKEWVKKYKVGGQLVSSAKELQEKYGDRVAAAVSGLRNFANLFRIL